MNRRTFLASIVALAASPLAKLYDGPRTIRWTGLARNHRWDDPRNWAGGRLPVDGDTAVFPETKRVGAWS